MFQHLVVEVFNILMDLGVSKVTYSASRICSVSICIILDNKPSVDIYVAN